jgi:AraC-like DNA-binding protein
VAVLYQAFPMVGRGRAQVWRYAPQYRRPRHIHAELEMNLVTAGHGTVGVGEDVIRVRAGDLLSWPPGVDHELLDASEDLELYVIGATPELSDRVLGSLRASAFGGPVRLTVAAGPLADLRERCAVPPGEGGGTVATETAVGDLWRDMQALRTAEEPANRAVRRRTVALLQSGPHMGRDGLARLLRTHPTEVSRHFHRDVGLTLSAYRARVRLVRFIETVDRGDTLLCAALEAGFGSYSQCHRVFHAVLGCSPRQFFKGEGRRRMQEWFEPAR